MRQAPQSAAVKRAQVEFHNFASLGEPARVLEEYAEKNRRRAALLRKHAEFTGTLSPFLEIGANAGHTSYMLANEFGARGFALDISADALRYGSALASAWRMAKAPVRVAGDAVNLPFQDGVLRAVFAFQMLSQFMDIEQVFLEVKRVLALGGVFVLSEEPLRRKLSLSLFRCPYYDRMKPWEQKLHDWGLLGYLVRDVIGASQEESFGIRQNHTMGLKEWDALVQKHFSAHEYEIFVPERGWGERVVKRAAVRFDSYRSVWRAARLLGGTFSAFCRKAGTPGAPNAGEERMERLLACPDCRGALALEPGETLACRCGFRAQREDGVYNLLASKERDALYPGDRDDVLDVSRPCHERLLGEGWYEVEGVFGNRYRWIGPRATARLRRVASGAQRLRVRGFAPEDAFVRGRVALAVAVNGAVVARVSPGRPGMFVIEADLPDAGEYNVEITAAPVWNAPGDERVLTVNLSLLRLIPREES